ncbi:MAG: helix-turn-helix domain-containing protein [Microbacterium gubbeenense]
MTPKQRAELVADYEAGMPVKAIAAKYRVHRGTIPTIVSRAGGCLRTSGLDDDGRHRACDLYEAGLTLAEVAERLSVDPKTVRDAVAGTGAKIRQRGRRARGAYSSVQSASMAASND